MKNFIKISRKRIKWMRERHFAGIIRFLIDETSFNRTFPRIWYNIVLRSDISGTPQLNCSVRRSATKLDFFSLTSTRAFSPWKPFVNLDCFLRLPNSSTLEGVSSRFIPFIAHFPEWHTSAALSYPVLYLSIFLCLSSFFFFYFLRSLFRD